LTARESFAALGQAANETARRVTAEPSQGQTEGVSKTLDVTNYQTGGESVDRSALKGRYLRRSLKDKRQAASVGADLYRGVRQLTGLSMTQAAFLTGSDVVSVRWAARREEYRDAFSPVSCR
jgi:hypothetical protein